MWDSPITLRKPLLVISKLNSLTLTQHRKKLMTVVLEVMMSSTTTIVLLWTVLQEERTEWTM